MRRYISGERCAGGTARWVVILRGQRCMEMPGWAQEVSNVDWDTSRFSWLAIPDFIRDPSPAQLVSARA